MAEQRPCILCQTEAKHEANPVSHKVTRVYCPRCGTYSINSVWATISLPRYVDSYHLISGGIREQTDYDHFL
jgi:hypothetical protein